MRKVRRDEILDYQTYDEQRDEIRSRILAIKEPRRVHAGEYLTFLFENTDTIRYQIQEMVRAERIVREKDIQHEIDTYNEVLGGDGELGATLLIEIDDKAERDEKLRKWRELPRHLFMRLKDGAVIRPTFDERQIGVEKLSSVQYLKFRVGDGVPVSVGSDLPDLKVEVELSERQREALLEDLRA